VVFVFFLAEELTRPFLPIYITQLAESGVNASLVVSLPLSLFILIAALAQPWGGRWSERVGRRRAFLFAAAISVIGLTMTAFAQTYAQMLLWRMVCAVGYGVVFITCQGYAVDNTTARTRARGMAMFVGGVMAAAVCGPSIGGIVADHIGFRPTLMISAAVALAAAIVAQALMRDAGPADLPAQQALGWREIVAVVRNRRMFTLLLLTAIPAKVVLSGVLFYLTPLYLAEMSQPQSVIGRVLIVYGIAMVLLGPLAARFADSHWRQRHWFVSLGALVSGLGLVPMLWMPGDFWVLVGGVASLGVGQALSVSPQLALVSEISLEECQDLGAATVLGVFRLIERAGGALGPFVAGLLAEEVGNAAAVAGIGLMALITGFLFMLSTMHFHTRREAGAEG